MILQNEQMTSTLRVQVRLYCTSVDLHCCTVRVEHAMSHFQSSTLDHAQRHVITVRPISKVARSLSYYK